MSTMEAADRKGGTVKFFQDEKGWGFIEGDDGTDRFVHHSNIQMDGRRTLVQGQRVTFRSQSTDRGEQAFDVAIS